MGLIELNSNFCQNILVFLVVCCSIFALLGLYPEAYVLWNMSFISFVVWLILLGIENKERSKSEYPVLKSGRYY